MDSSVANPSYSDPCCDAVRMYEFTNKEVGSIPITSSILKRHAANARVVEFHADYCLLKSRRFQLIKLHRGHFRTLKCDLEYGEWLLDPLDPCNLHVILDPNESKAAQPRTAIDGHMIEECPAMHRVSKLYWRSRAQQLNGPDSDKSTLSVTKPQVGDECHVPTRPGLAVSGSETSTSYDVIDVTHHRPEGLQTLTATRRWNMSTSEPVTIHRQSRHLSIEEQLGTSVKNITTWEKSTQANLDNPQISPQLSRADSEHFVSIFKQRVMENKALFEFILKHEPELIRLVTRMTLRSQPRSHDD